MTPRTFLTRAALILGLGLSLVSCPSTKTDALKDIHDQYRQAFYRMSARSVENYDSPSGDNKDLFNECLTRIQAYKATHGQGAVVNHLKVLEGMIYLQSESFGMARLVQNDVAAAGKGLSSMTGFKARDELFAENFKDLVSGWEALSGSITREQGLIAEQVAAKIIGALNDAKAKIRQDDAAIYLATTAAIFNYTAAVRSYTGQANKPTRQRLYQEGAQAIKMFLSQSEISAAEQLDAGSIPATGRRRYIEWYQYLTAEANAP